MQFAEMFDSQYEALEYITMAHDGEFEVLHGDLDLNEVIELPDGLAPKVEKCLFLGDLNILPQTFRPSVGEHIFMPGIKELTSGFEPKAKEVYYNNRNGKLKVFTPNGTNNDQK